MTKFNNQLLQAKKATIRPKVALDALLEMYNDEDYATHQHHSDPDFTTQNGKMMEKGTEVEQGALNDAIPARALASAKLSTQKEVRMINGQEYLLAGRHSDRESAVKEGNALRDSWDKVRIIKISDWDFLIYVHGSKRTSSSTKCAACESGDCIPHKSPSTTFVGGGTVNDLTKSVVKAPLEPTLEDATFFKESDDEMGKRADTKSYGAGTPNGGTPTSPSPTPAPMAPPAPAGQPPQQQAPVVNPIPPVNTVNKTPQQLSQEAQNPAQTSGGLTPQQLTEVLNAVKGAALNPDEASRMIAAIGIHKSPTMLPPRDDMRSHLDEDVKEEVKAGVKEAPDTAPNAAPQQPEQTPWQTTNQDMLLNRALASTKKAWHPEDDETGNFDDDISDGAYGTMYGKPLGQADPNNSPAARLDYLRDQLRAESISYGELEELQSLAKYIEPGDVELLEAAGVPEFEEDDEPTKPPRKRFRPTKGDKSFLKSLGIKAKKASKEYIFLTQKIIADLARLAEIAPEGGDIQSLAAMDSSDLQSFLDVELGTRTSKSVFSSQEDVVSNLLRSITTPRTRGMSTDAHRSIVRAMRGQLMQVLREQGYSQNDARLKMRELISNHSKTAVQTEEGVNQVCPSCSGQNFKKFEGSDSEDGSLVECLDCACFFAF